MDNEIAAYHRRVARRFLQFSYDARPVREGDGYEFARWLVPAVWKDVRDNLHIDVEWLLSTFELEPSVENENACRRFAIFYATANEAEHERIPPAKKS